MTHTRHPYRIDFMDDLMVLLDAENHGIAAHRVDAHDAAGAASRIDEWARDASRYGHTFDVAKAKRQLGQLVRAMR